MFCPLYKSAILESDSFKKKDAVEAAQCDKEQCAMWNPVVICCGQIAGALQIARMMEVKEGGNKN